MQILHVDDHALTRGAIKELINHSIEDVEYSQADGAQQAVKILNDCKNIGMAIIDINLKGMDGIELAERILHKWPTLRILFCSMYDDSSIVKRAMLVGASGYISKSETPEDFIKAVKAVAAGQTYLMHQTAIELASLEYEGKSRHPVKVLTTREFSIFFLVAKGYSRHQIADEINIAPKTVSNYITLIKQKLNIYSNYDFVVTAQEFDIIP